MICRLAPGLVGSVAGGGRVSPDLGLVPVVWWGLVGCRYGPEHTFDLLARWLTALAAVVDRLAAQDLHGLSDAVRAERVLVLRRLVDRLEGHRLHELAAVARGAAAAEQRHQRRGLWLSPTLDGMVAVEGPLEPEAGQTCWPPWTPDPPTTSTDPRSGTNAAPPPWPSWPAAPWKPATPDRWVRPQLPGTVDLDSRQAAPPGRRPRHRPPDPQARRRLACDRAVGWVLVTRHRHPTHPTTTATTTPAATTARAIPAATGGRRPQAPAEMGTRTWRPGSRGR